jgi:hypothetical protein
MAILVNRETRSLRGWIERVFAFIHQRKSAEPSWKESNRFTGSSNSLMARNFSSTPLARAVPGNVSRYRDTGR